MPRRALVNARLYEEQRREAESAKALLELSSELSSSTGLEAVATRIASGAARIMRSERASVWLPEHETGVLACSRRGSTTPRARTGRWATSVPESLERLLATSSTPFLMTREDLLEHLVDADEQVCETAVVVAFPAGAGTGAIAVALGSPGELDDRRRELLAGIAAQARLAVSNAHSFQGLERSFLSTIEALANALEATDEYTSFHARWICDVALRVGEELGLTPAELKRLELGALFHDIGKIGVPAADPAEARPADRRGADRDRAPPGARRADPRAARAVRGRPDRSSAPATSATTARATPTGSRARPIPLEARIIFACDAYHAMTSDRPYRVGAARRPRRCAASPTPPGTQFDPRVVEAFLGVLARDGAAG